MSNNIDIKFNGKENEIINWKEVKAPLDRFNFFSTKINFLIYKHNLRNNQLNNNSMKKLVELNNNINNQNNEYLILNCWSLDSSLINGRDFGLSPTHNYIWFKNTSNSDSIRYNFDLKSKIEQNYNILNNNNSLLNLKKNRKTILMWYDLCRYINYGLKINYFDKSKVFTYD